MKKTTCLTFRSFLCKIFAKASFITHSIKGKKNTFLLLFFLTLFGNSAFSQVVVPFTPRLDGGSIKVKGDIKLIGNNIITGGERHNNSSDVLPLPYNGTAINNDYEGVYINEASGGDSSIFSSSSADLAINNDCKEIVWAGLYWSAAYGNEYANDRSEYVDDDNLRAHDFTQVKFKLPNSTTFMDLTADETIFDGFDPNDPVDGSFPDAPYACFKDVTSLIHGLADADGTYTIANQHATRGHKRGGCSAGWTLVVIYESPSEPSKFISVFDGFAGVRNEGTSVAEFNVSGFQTLPDDLPVYAKVGVAALEGDYDIVGDSFEFKAGSNSNYTDISDGLNDASNFFNSRITEDDAYMTNRNPNSENTMGFEVKSVDIPNPNNDIVPNDETSGTFRLTTDGDGYAAFLATFAVDIIEPNIRLTKVVQDEQGNDIGGEIVNLGERLNYVLGIENIGNDDAINLTIRDVLPINVNFDSASDIIDLSDGVSVVSYNPATREIIFAVEDSFVEKNSGLISKIEFSVQVVTSCDELSDACSDLVRNQAYATYTGEISGLTISDDPSYDAINGCLLSPQSTNFLADISGCTFSEEVILCGETTTLTAPGGYDSYSWSTSLTGSPVIGTGQTITIDEIGTYYVNNTALAPCQSTQKEFNVVTFGANVPNPVLPYADQIVQCPNDGKDLPYIFLCGGNGGKFIETNLSDSTSIIWETLNTSSCSAVINDACANEDPGCSWSEVGTGPNFMADLAGEYRLTINYPGGCFNRFYFNVYTNLLNPSHTIQNIVCNTQGQITVNDVPSGYEYSLDNSSWQDENDFPINAAGLYTVYIRQKDVSPNPCIFTITNIQISELNPQLVTTINQPLCYNEQGSIRLSVNDAEAQYTYTILQGGTVVNTVGPITERTYLFENLNAGVYEVRATTDDGCVLSEAVELINPTPLTATANVTNITCVDGEIEVVPAGGTAPYYYYINSTTDFQTTGTIVVDAPGVFDITVLDGNNCSVDLNVTVDQLPQPVFTMENTGISCYGDNSGSITFNVTNANGYTLEYSIDNGANYLPNNTFSNLTPGTYQTILKYSLLGEDCYSPVEAIIIDQPTDALTASAGVSELAGCGVNDVENGKIRITNPEGGVPPYEYSVDNSNWGTIKEFEVAPGTYTLYIRDAVGCVLAMPGIILDPKPVPPTIDDNVDPEYNCDGTANASVNVTNNGGSNFEYTYLLNGVENTNTADPTTFLNVPSGSHTITVTYKLLDVPTYSNLLLETFGSGDDVESPGINTAFYCFEYQQAPPYCKDRRNIQDGDYSVTAHIESPYGDWVQPRDHTSNNTDPKGRALVVNIGDQLPEDDVLYRKTINDIIPNQPINFELFVFNLMQTGSTKFDPNLTVALVDASGSEISSFSTGNVPKTEQWENYPKTPYVLNPGNNTTLEFLVRSTVRQTSGNDVAIDDIKVYQLPKSCITEVEIPILIEPGKAFTADVVSANDVDCFGANNGEIQISATNFNTTNGYQYSIDGSTWNTVNTSPYTITGLGPDTYDVQIRYDATSTGCEFTIEQEITEPTEIDLTLDTRQATCSTPASIEATVTGGTPPYTIELLDTAGTAVDIFPNSGTLTGVAPGDYQVRVTDANSCSPSGTVNVTIDAVTMPTATVTIARDCVNHAGGAKISMLPDNTTGKAPFSFRYDRYDITGTNLLESTTYNASKEFNNVPVGVYHIYMIDKNGCEVLLPITTVEEPVTISAALVKDIDCSNTPDAQIEVTIADGYPDYDYEVSFNGGNFNSLGTLTTAGGGTFTYTATAAGTYQFRVFDAITGKNCDNVSAIITVSAPETPDFTTNKVDITCAGADDGQITISQTAGAYDFEYSIDGGTNYQTSATFNNLAAGIYDVIIIDGKECVSVIKEVEILEPSPLSVNASATTLSCDTNNVEQAAVVTIAVPTTGTAPYQYSFDGSGYSNTRTLSVYDNGSVQTINYSVRDANGCTAGGTLDIQPLNSPTDLTFTPASPITCVDTTTDVKVEAVGGVKDLSGNLFYEILSPASAITSNNTGDFTGLLPDTYVFKVTDANNCYFTKSYTIDAVTPIALIARVQSDVLCHGDNTGAIQIEVSGFSGKYSYSDDGGITFVTGQTTSPIDLTGYTVGTYDIVVTDEVTGCTAKQDVTIAQPTAALTLTELTNTNANCNNTGAQVTVEANGGTPNYSYAFVTNGTTPSATDYTSSATRTLDPTVNTDWDVYVRDANNCTTRLDVVIAGDSAPVLTRIDINEGCTLPFEIEAIPDTTVGVAPYEYSLNGGTYQSSPIFTVNTDGTQNITIRDANGCTASSSAILYPVLTGNAILNKDITCEIGNENAIIELTASGGSGGYNYEVSTDGGFSYAGLVSLPFTTNTAGTYWFKIKDTATNCEVIIEDIIVTDTEPVAVTPILVNPTCNGSTDGSILLDATAGAAPFEYSIDGGANFVPTNVFGGLADGTYSYVVKDSKGCTFGDDITLIEPVAIVPNIVLNPVVCNSTTPGSIVVDITSGGVAPFEYTILDNAFTIIDTYTEINASPSPAHSFGNLSFGDYYITIVDANGCEFKSGKLRIETPPYLTFKGEVDSNNCSTGVDYEVEIATGGVPDFIYSIYGQPGTETLPTSSPTHVFTGLLHGVTYFLQVEDVNGCISILEATMPDPPSNIEITNVVTSNVNCFGTPDGTITFDVERFDGSATDLNYRVLNALTLNPIAGMSGTISGPLSDPASGTISNLAAGNYVLQVTEVGGTECSNTTPFTITQPTQALASSITNTVNANCNADALVTLTTTGGTGPYKYAAGISPFVPNPSDFGTSNVLALDPSLGLNWEIVVRDVNDCEVTLTETITTDAPPTVNIPNAQCFVGTAFSITLSEVSGSLIGPFTFHVSTSAAAPNPAAFGSNDTFLIPAAGTYYVHVKDGNGCIDSKPYVVNPQLTLDVTATELDCVVNPAAFTFTANGGDGTNSYEMKYDDGTGFTAYSNITLPYTTTNAGDYQFRVIDGAGCDAESAVVTIAPTVRPTFKIAQTNVSCNTGGDGQIIVTPDLGVGVPPYEYGIDDGSVAGIVYQGTDNQFPNLGAGTYDVYVRDSKSCVSLPTTVTITEPTALALSLTGTSLRCGINNSYHGAVITASPGGGTPSATGEYSYSFNGSSPTRTNTYTTNVTGPVTVTVTDEKGCEITDTFNVLSLTPPSGMDITHTAVTCSNTTSVVTISNVIDGVLPYTYEIVSPASATSNVTGAINGVFTGLDPATYTFRVTDANGCYFDEVNYRIDQVVNIDVSASEASPALCESDSNGVIRLDVAYFSGNYSYQVDGGTLVTGQNANTLSLPGYAAGTYNVVVTDETTDCTATASVTITEPTELLITNATATNVHCNNYFSQITVTATNGTPNYSYAAVISGNTPVAADYVLNANVLTVDTNNGTDLDWDVYVQDANGCTEDTTVSITLETKPTVTAPAIATCATPGGGYEFTVSGAGGVLPYEFSVGNGFQSSPTFTGLTPGTYTVTIKDANGCEGTSAAVTVYNNLEVYTSISAQPSCNDNDGEINVTATGGSGNYMYSLDGGTPQASNVFTGLTHTAYKVTVTDTDTNCSSDASVTLEAPTPVGFTTDVTPVTCFAGNDGVIEVLLDANQDNPIYSFEIIAGPITVAAQPSNVFTGLEAGTYTVQVTSGRGCDLTQDVTVGESAAIAVPAPTVVQYACLADTNSSDFATITVDATAITGGSGNYVFYEFVRGTTTVQASTNPVYTETDLAGGSYTINVYDNNGCVGSTTTTIDPFVAIDDLDIAVSNAITCISDEEISITVTTTGTVNLSYTVTQVDIAGNPLTGGYTQNNTTGNFTGLTIGNYLVEVLNTNTGCILRTFHYVQDPNTFDVTIDNVVDVTCLGDADGSVDVTFIDRAPLPTDEADAFTYNVVDALGNPIYTNVSVANAGATTITGLASGTYTITATLDNTPFCEVVKNFTISGPTAALAIQETHTEITCIGNDGTISATATGGWPGGYEYQLELGTTVIAPFSATSSFTGLDAGDYTVSVRDSKGCVAPVLVQLVNPTPISATATVDINPLSCFGDTNATITVSTPTGGQGSNYTYTINRVLPSGTSSGPQLSNVFSGLGAGTYNVTVNDGWNCSFTTADVVITEPTSIQADLALTRSQTCVLDSELTLTVSGGTAPYQYSDDANFTTVSTIFDPNVVISVSPGTYQYYVRDANGCATGISNEIKIDPLPPLTVDAQATNTRINCYGDNTGSIIAEAKGGLGNYVYTLRDGAGLDITPAPTQNTPGEFTELVAGDYQVFVTSGDCDVMSSLITISQPDMPLEYTFAVTDVMCSGGDDGILEITATGGTGIIKYAISPQLNQFFETSTFEDLPVGNYQAIVQDELGCFEVFDFTIGEPTPVILNIVPNSIVPEICAGDLDGAFSVDITGGTPPYSVTLDDINGNYVTGTATQTQFDFTGLAGGDHIVYVMDAQGCESEWNVSFPESVNLDPQVSVTYDCVSNLSTNTVTVTIDSSIQDPTQVEYALNGGAFQTSNIFVDVPSGVDQYIDVRHSNGCIKQTPLFDIDHIDPLELVLEDGELNQIVAVATGGVAPFEYALNGGSFGSSEKFLIYASGDYTVTVRDSNGCEASATRYFEFIDVCIPNYFTPNADGNQDGWGPGCTTQYKDLIVHVFDRYGRKLADLKVDEKWDGNYNGKELPTGDYWYIVKLNDPYYDKEFVGHFTLYR